MTRPVAGKNAARGMIAAHRAMLLTAALGALFALGLSQVWNMEGRWFAITIVAILALAASAVVIDRFSETLLIVLFFCVPLAGFTKWLSLDPTNETESGIVVYSGTLGIGLVDFILAGLCLSWFGRIFISWEDPLPKLGQIDKIMICVVLAHALSIWNAPRPDLALFATLYVLKYAAIYFYVSRKLERRHLPWLIGAFFVAIALEAALGLLQHQTGLFRGLALDKGAAGEALNYQYEVPGIESVHRATGTTYDSHALGLYLAMLAPYAFVLAFARRAVWPRPVMSGVIYLAALVGLIVTFSRSAWLTSLVVICFMSYVFVRWRERHVLPIAVGGLLVGLVLAPWAVDQIVNRFASAPAEIMTARFVQFPVALAVWEDNPWFGFGAGNYYEALRQYNVNWAPELPVHNVFLWILAETGLFGVVSFFTLILAAAVSCWRLVRANSGLTSRIALAALAGLIAYVLDGLTDPLFREPVVYMMFWLTIALSVALHRIARDDPDFVPNHGT